MELPHGEKITKEFGGQHCSRDVNYYSTFTQNYLHYLKKPSKVLLVKNFNFKAD